MVNEQLEMIKINREKVRERIDNFIHNDSKNNFYIPALNRELVEKYLYFSDQAKKSGMEGGPTAFIPLSIIEMHKQMARVQIYAEYTAGKLDLEARLFVYPLMKNWKLARYWEDNPLRGIRKLSFWHWGSQKCYDRTFLKGMKKAYEWLQEDDPLKQCDIKNKHAILGFQLLNQYNQLSTTTRKAPLDSFVAEQIERVSEEVINKSLESETSLKWVNEKRIVDFNATLGELYL